MSEHDRLRLAVVSDAIYPFHLGGKELRYHELLARLPERGIEVTLYTMHWWDKEPPVDSITYRAISRLRPLYRAGHRSIASGLLFALATLRLLWAPRPDILEADHMPYLQLFPLWLVTRLRRIPLVVTWHEIWGPAYWQRYLPGWRGRLAAAIERWSTQLPDYIVAVSEETAERLRNMGVPPDHIMLIPAGVRATEIAATDPDPRAPDILSIGRLIQHKRHDLVISAFARLAAADPNLRLGIIGHGPDRAALEAQVADLGIGGQITFHGSLDSFVDVWAFLRGARVLAAPSEREGFGLVVAEALAAGTPVVVSDHADNASRHLVDHGIDGSIIPAGDVEALAAALSEWFRHEPSRAEATARFERRHPQLTWNRTADVYAALLRHITESPDPRAPRSAAEMPESGKGGQP